MKELFSGEKLFKGNNASNYIKSFAMLLVYLFRIYDFYFQMCINLNLDIKTIYFRFI